MPHNSLEKDITDDETVQFVLKILLLCILLVFFCRQTGHRFDIKQF